MTLLQVPPMKAPPANDVATRMVEEYAAAVRAARNVLFDAKDADVAEAKTRYHHALIAYFAAAEFVRGGGL